MFITEAARAALLMAGLGLSLAPAGGRAQDGPELASELGCGACHAGMPGPELVRARAPRILHEGFRLPAGFVFDYLANPTRRRPDIGASRMPDFHLDEAERAALALYVGISDQRDPALEEALERNPQVDAGLGARVYAVLGCGGCHGDGEGASYPARRVGPDLSREGARARPDWLATFLQRPTPVRAPGHPGAPGSRMPDFRLTVAETGVLAAFLGSPSSAGSADAPSPLPALTPFQAARTRRALEGRFACLGCHRVGGTGGEIGPRLDGIAQRLRPAFVAEIITRPAEVAAGSGMPHQPMPRREALRLAALLVADPGAWTGHTPRSLADPDHPAWASGAPAPAGSDGDGEALYARHCAACHGATGDGNGWNAGNLPVPPTAHSDSTLMSRRPDDTLYDGIHAGAYVLDGSVRMPPFGGILTPAQIRALVAHVRTLCSCTGPEWSLDGRR
ncbi:MAG: c-type cytochrome [Gemmatimonadota bacterium]|nr:c-type cytochrome [Gemmatimonadota bacterium]MDH5760326.1 c-type cytochrome [Gemmatimonadota bacterium]